MSSDYNLELLKCAEVRDAVERYLESDSSYVALRRDVPHASVVATQVKYLQRARRKLPSLYESRCAIPPRAFSQSSCEESAERKPLSDGSVLDLTCGLGVDSLALSRRFDRVVALERDEALAEVVRYNMSLLGVNNIEIVADSAESYVARCDEGFDWVFVDPDRRSDSGNKMVCMEDCSPNVLELLPQLERVARRVAIKLSPMYDCAEAFRRIPGSEVEVVSLAGECKELNIYTGAEREVLRIAQLGVGEWLFSPEDMLAEPTREEFLPDGWHYLHIPDVALQKARVAVAALKPYASIWSNNGFAFSVERIDASVACRSYEIVSCEAYRPKELKRRFKGVGIEVIKRDTQLSVEAFRRAIGARAGSDKTLAITTIGRDIWVIEIKPL